MTTTHNTDTAATTKPRHLTADVLVIGWGKGGKTFAAAMAGQGKSVVMVEQDALMYGGTCINIGCVPTKALVHESSRRREDDDPQEFFRQAVQFRDTLIGRLNEVNLHLLLDQDTATVVDGRARFTGPRAVEVTPSSGGQGVSERLRITAETVVINTGAVPVMPPIQGIDHPRVHDSTSLQHVDPFPARLVIVGGGPIGLEFASLFSGFGSEVTVIARGQILADEEPEVREAVHQVLTEEGIRLLTDCDVEAVEDAQDGTGVRVRIAGQDPVEADAVLMATGRKPATEDLGLEAAGVQTDARGAVVVDDHLRTSAEGVYALGDVHGGQQQTYLSLDDHRILLSTLTGDGSRRLSDRVGVPATTFLTPPLSSVGMTEAQARQAGHAVKTAVAEVEKIKAMPRPKTLRDARGIIKVVVDADTDLLLGARLFHVDSQEVINLLALALRTGVTATDLRDGIWTHPSSTEALNEVLGQLG